MQKSGTVSKWRRILPAVPQMETLYIFYSNTQAVAAKHIMDASTYGTLTGHVNE